MATLYVVEQGARIEKEYRRILVVKDDEVLASVPLGRVSDVVLVGNVGTTTTPALLALLNQECNLSLVTRGGRLLGRLVCPMARNAPLRRAQYAMTADPEFSFQFARAVVNGKLHNSLVLMKRLVRRHKDLSRHWVERTEHALAQTLAVESVDKLRGLEGSAARSYFGLLRESVRGKIDFGPRTRRPPKDPMNALLGLGYTLLYQAVMTALEVVGLDAYVGFFHSNKYGRPALALDLAEEFRAPVVDSLVLMLVNKRILGPKDFDQERHGGPCLSRRGLRVFFQAFADRLQTRVMHPRVGRSLSYQKILEVQARCVAKSILRTMPEYVTFRWR